MSKFQRNHKRSAKLTGEQVLDIRRRYLDGESQGALARDFHVSVGQIGRIVRGESWQETAQVEDPQDIRDAAAQSLSLLRTMIDRPLPTEEREAQERGEALAQKMGQEVAKAKRVEDQLSELSEIPDLALTKPNPYY